MVSTLSRDDVKRECVLALRGGAGACVIWVLRGGAGGCVIWAL